MLLLIVVKAAAAVLPLMFAVVHVAVPLASRAIPPVNMACCC